MFGYFAVERAFEGRQIFVESVFQFRKPGFAVDIKEAVKQEPLKGGDGQMPVFVAVGEVARDLEFACFFFGDADDLALREVDKGGDDVLHIGLFVE